MTDTVLDKQLIDFLEDVHGLHTALEILYVVDGYEVTLTYDIEPCMKFKGETLRDALCFMMDYWIENRSRYRRG